MTHFVIFQPYDKPTFKTKALRFGSDEGRVKQNWRRVSLQGQVSFLCSVVFYGRLNRFVWLCGFITFLWSTMWLIVVGCVIP